MPRQRPSENVLPAPRLRIGQPYPMNGNPIERFGRQGFPESHRVSGRFEADQASLDRGWSPTDGLDINSALSQRGHVALKTEGPAGEGGMERVRQEADPHRLG